MRIALLVLGLVWLQPRAAWACVTCAVGDPTRTVMGTGQALSGRVRLLGEYRYRSERFGQDMDAEAVSESRLVLGAAWSPTDWVTLSLTAPLVNRRVEYADLSANEVTNLGDVEVLARFTVLRARSMGRHQLGLSAGVQLPTALRQETGGPRNSLEAQAGVGALTGSAGVFYMFSKAEWSVFVSASGRVSTRGWERFLSGPVFLASAHLQVQPASWIGLRLGVDARVSGANTFGDLSDPNSGGTVLMLSPGLLLSPVTDLIIHAGAGVTVANALRGAQSDPVSAMAGVTYDF
jgi:hypothetical protein